MVKEQKTSQRQYLEDTDRMHQLILHNDEVNTFDHVINCLVEICRHTSEQAEQCAWIVHHHGKYVIKTGGLEELKPMCEKLCVEGLMATVA